MAVLLPLWALLREWVWLALVLVLVWRMGGSTSFRVWLFLLLLLLVTAINAWLMGWLLRAVAHFWIQDVLVRDARAALEVPPSESEAL